MSVRVNLLPEATKQRDRAAHQRSLAALAGVVFLAGLGGVYVWQTAQVSQAETALAAEQARTSELQARQMALIGFQDLADRLDESEAVLVAAMADEVSVAGILQDIAAVMPSDTQLDALSVSIAPPLETELTEAVGSFTMTGRTLASHAPGVERVLLALEKVVSFSDLYMGSSVIEDPENERIATFSLDGQLGQEARTERYADGLPESLR